MSEDVYAGRGYGAMKIGWGKRPGVVVVDLQKVFTDARYDLGGAPLVMRATENTAKLLEVARKAGIPVANVYTAYASPADAPRWKIARVTDFRHGSELAELDPSIHDPAYDAVFCKSGPSAMFQTSVITHMTRNEVDTLIICGCTTSGCVRATVNDAFSYGFRVMVPEPCVGDMDQRPHDDNLRDVGRRYCDILTLEEAISGIEAATTAPMASARR